MDSSETPRLALFRYRLLLLLLSPLLLAHTLWQALRARDGRFLRQRLGLYREPLPRAAIWLHAASVGEVNAALPLLAELRRAHPEVPLLLTTATPSGGRQALRQLPAGVHHAYLPLDWSGAVRRFLRRYRPRCALILETELWPNLYAACARHGVAVVIVNGRLSLRTLNAPRWLRRQYQCALLQVRAVLARSDTDRTGFLALGAPPARVRVIGNLKFSATPPRLGEPITLPRPWVVAASTRDGEEALVWRAWQAAHTGGRLLVIVPRHPQRLGAILRDLALPAEQVAVRSRGDAVTAATRVYVADTFGELPAFMAGADLVFVGGSLVARGGQNVLEPAYLGKAILCGPHMDNFTDEARLLREADGVVQVADATALGAAFTQLLAQPERRAALGERARAVVAERRDMAARYAAALEELCTL